MKPHQPITSNLPDNDLGEPNDDGFVLGTAGRDEDPNATTDWDHPKDASENVLTPDDKRGMPGYPRESDKASPAKQPSTDDTEAGGKAPDVSHKD